MNRRLRQEVSHALILAHHALALSAGIRGELTGLPECLWRR